MTAVSPFPADRYPGSTKAPLAYPGDRPSGSYLYYDGQGYELVAASSLAAFRVLDADRQVPLDDFLRAHDSAGIADRHPVLAVGSNGCPGRLAEKFGLGRGTGIPVLVGEAADTTSVYSRRLTDYGAFPATYLRQVGATARLAVTLLDAEQLRVMDGSEHLGSAYSRVPVPLPFRVSRGPTIEGVTSYMDTRLLAYRQAPVLLSAFEHSGIDWPTMSQSQVLRLVMDAAGLLLGGRIEARHQSLVSDPSLREALQAFVDSEMGTLQVDAQGRLVG